MSFYLARSLLIKAPCAWGTILQWHKAPGNLVRGGEMIVSYETDKIVVDVPMPDEYSYGVLAWRTEYGSFKQYEVLARIYLL